MKSSLLFLLLTIPGFKSIGQTSELPDPELYFSAIIVSNIDSSIAWYTRHLGLKQVNRVVNEEIGFKQSNLQRGKLWIELIESNSTLYKKDTLADHDRRTRIDGFF